MFAYFVEFRAFTITVHWTEFSFTSFIFKQIYKNFLQ